jgi:hypothetical protein
MIISIANSGKSPLSPLFQRGELAVERAELPSTYRAILLPSFLHHSPFEKGGQKGGFEFFHSFGDLEGFSICQPNFDETLTVRWFRGTISIAMLLLTIDGRRRDEQF